VRVCFDLRPKKRASKTYDKTKKSRLLDDKTTTNKQTNKQTATTISTIYMNQEDSSSSSSRCSSIHNNPTNHTMTANHHPPRPRLPHEGELRRRPEDDSFVLAILQQPTSSSLSSSINETYELHFDRTNFEFAQRLFAILDTENQGFLPKAAVHEFTTLRCPVFYRRDEDLMIQTRNTATTIAATPSTISSSSSLTSSLPTTPCSTNSPTFDEIWTVVGNCANHSNNRSNNNNNNSNDQVVSLGLEGWLVFCRFIALAQYLEAKRRFSARHLQQTMRHRNSPRGSEVVVVDVPPPQPPAPLTVQALMECDTLLSVPELDLDHSLLAVHDGTRNVQQRGAVQVQLLGKNYSTKHHSSSSNNHNNNNNSGSSSSSKNSNSSSTPLDFAISYCKGQDVVWVRRSMADLKWLDETFATQKVLGGTLCGRILPLFPTYSHSTGSLLLRDDSTSSSLLTHTTTTTIKVAKKSVGKIRDAAKSLWGTTLQAGSAVMNMTTSNNINNIIGPQVSDDASTDSGTSSASTAVTRTAAVTKPPRRTATGSSSTTTTSFDNFYNAQAPAAKARQLERYLNYLLEHPALSTSFPLNTILMASQSGLDAAKKALRDCAAANKEIQEQTPRLDDGKLRLAVADYGWVRTAAQAAIALRIHGMLETTGMPSASARLQHASLPAFPRGRWDSDVGSDHQPQPAQSEQQPRVPQHVGFEDGVVQVSSGLRRDVDLLGLGTHHAEDDPNGGSADDDDGYDLLPLPIPAPERRILMAGSSSGASNSSNLRGTSQETRFHYGSATLPENFLFQDDESAVLLGTLSIDDNIDKLREVIGSVDNTLRRCLASGGGIGKVRKDRNIVQLDVVKGFDGWEGMRGQFISQRSLLKGVNGLEQSKDIYEEGDLGLIDDFSWQTSLARSAVSAAEDVRSAVRASNTAANAKAAASNAAMSAQNACDSGNFSNIEEARAAQTRASIAQSHAIHAAVVDHEAKSVKRRAAVALANDVKCWNVHRKRELLRSTLAYAKSQHEATRRAVDAWSCLRDGYIESVVMPPLYDRRVTPTRPIQFNMQHSSSSDFFGDGLDAMGTKTRYTTEQLLQESSEVTATIFGGSSTMDSPPIVPVEHDLLHQPPSLDLTALEAPSDFFAEVSNDFLQNASALREKEDNQTDDSSDEETSKSTAFYETHALLPIATASPIPEEQDNDGTDTEFHDSSAENPMTASMQSLVDGLMNWGGTIDIDEELVLPPGMAASIAFEDSESLHKQKNK